MKFKELLDENTKPKPIRFEIGKKLSSKEKKELLKNIGDVYKDNNLEKEYKGIDSRGEEIYGYLHKPQYFLTSDITKKKIRYYIILPDKRIAHPSELFPNISKITIDNEMLKKEKEEENKKEEQKRTLDIANDANSIGDANMIYNKLYGVGGSKYSDNFILLVKGKKHIKLPNLPQWKDRISFLKRSGFKIAHIMKNGNLEKVNPNLVIYKDGPPSSNILKKYFNV